MSVKFILASGSPRRQYLLAKEGFKFQVVVSNAEEDENPFGNPEKMVAENSLNKAKVISEKYPEALVLGADTTVALDDKVLNKPVDLVEAREMLHSLSGREHTVYTGVSLVLSNKNICWTKVFASKVKFKTLSDEIISLYFNIVNPLDKAGAYGIQEGKDLIIESYQEPLSNIMGLPVELIASKIKTILNEK